RVDAVRAAALQAALPDAEYHVRARAVTVRRGARAAGRPGILILTAGTGDVPVAEEARVTAESMGHAPEVVHDLGVAGLHRILAQQERLRAARVIVVAAGMDGALPSVVGGLVGVPVIALPTSVGYGAAFAGLAPLLSMLNACAPNVAVVNVDNGFGAGYLAALINAAPESEGRDP
ncbi:MAG: nickel pincer cofactor biosynthesis protein LarB, partial [Planctomycetota bacterium]|nr:nickel pincer cofactor biosynthesis protein LarB [Planctomycetota bacterium]